MLKKRTLGIQECMWAQYINKFIKKKQEKMKIKCEISHYNHFSSHANPFI